MYIVTRGSYSCEDVTYDRILLKKIDTQKILFFYVLFIQKNTTVLYVEYSTYSTIVDIIRFVLSKKVPVLVLNEK